MDNKNISLNQSNYIKIFKKYGAYEFSNLLRINKTIKTLDLSFQGLENDECLFICMALSDNNIIQNVNLSYNNYNDMGYIAIYSMININKSIKSLNIAMIQGYNLYNPIFNNTFKNITESISDNKKIISLNLNGILIDTIINEYIINMFKSNKTIRSLYLSECKNIDEEFFGKIIEIGTSLTFLDLSNNLFENVNYIFRPLSVNKNLIEIDLSNCGILYSECSILCEALSNNTSLKKINISNNVIEDYGCDLLINFLTTNKSIISINMSKNNISYINIDILIKMLESNKTLRNIDITKNLINGFGLNTRNINDILNKNNTLETFDIFDKEDKSYKLQKIINEKIREIKIFNKTILLLQRNFRERIQIPPNGWLVQKLMNESLDEYNKNI
jgi:hypothetical protein